MRSTTWKTFDDSQKSTATKEGKDWSFRAHEIICLIKKGLLFTFAKNRSLKTFERNPVEAPFIPIAPRTVKWLNKISVLEKGGRAKTHCFSKSSMVTDANPVCDMKWYMLFSHTSRSAARLSVNNTRHFPLKIMASSVGQSMDTGKTEGTTINAVTNTDCPPVCTGWCQILSTVP